MQSLLHVKPTQRQTQFARRPLKSDLGEHERDWDGQAVTANESSSSSKSEEMSPELYEFILESLHGLAYGYSLEVV